MRWLSFSIFAYLMLGIQLGIDPFARYRGVSPNLVLIGVIFISLNASRPSAMLGGFLLGLMQDSISLEPMGLHAFSYGLISMAVAGSVESVRRTHPLTHVTVTFAGGVFLGMLLIVHDYFRPAAPTYVGPRVAAVMVVYTTLLAPFVIGLLQLSNRLFAFEQHGRRRK